MKKVLSLILVVLIFTTGCTKDYSKGTIDGVTYKEVNKVTKFVKLETTNGVILLELYPDKAPITVENFQNLVKDKFYDNLIFHRVVKDFVIQTGDPEGTGFGGSSNKIKGEFESNGVKNDLSHTRGIVSMARSNDKDSASSQFFIVVKDAKFLDGEYAAFGEVIAGMDVVDKISLVNVDNNDKPLATQKLKSARFIEIEE